MSECNNEQQRYCGEKFDDLLRVMNANHLELSTKFVEQQTILSRVELQTTKTNGRVTVLENARERSVGRGQLIIAMIGSGGLVGLLFTIVQHFWK